MKSILKKSLKFGVVLSIIVILLIVINIIIENSADDFASYKPFIFLETFTKAPGELLSSSIYNKYYLCIYEPQDYAFKCPETNVLMVYIYLLTVVFYFIIGTIVGFIINFIYNKIKRN